MPVHRRQIAFVPQDGALFPHLSVARNIGFGLDRAMPGRQARIAELMEMVELRDRTRDRYPHELSGGQQQRVALARALARKPKLMLLDEPFSALDAGLRENVRRATGRVLRAAGVTTILVTHDQNEALSFADGVAVLRQGRVVQAGPPVELYRRPVDRQTAAFLGDAIVLEAVVEGGWAISGLGRVAVDDTARTGRVQIMLRPEQIRLASVDTENDDAETCLGEVTDVEFGGAMSLVTVVPVVSNDLPVPAFTIRVFGGEGFAAGARVRIIVSGKAHIFEGQ